MEGIIVISLNRVYKKNHIQLSYKGHTPKSNEKISMSRALDFPEELIMDESSFPTGKLLHRLPTGCISKNLMLRNLTVKKHLKKQV